jgi:trans-aconitate 2-methyltransferase
MARVYAGEDRAPASVPRVTGERYLYGDDPLAAERLDLVARLFEPSTAAFLSRHGPRGPALAVDVGCGPGHTTRLTHRVLEASRTLGLDQSEAYVRRASIGAPPGVAFARHDARDVPFPEGPAQVVFCRLLLAHLNRPMDVLAGWATQLDRGGVLMVDELDHAETDDDAFRRYLEVAVAVIAGEGSALFAGPVVSAAAAPPGTERIADEASRIDLSPADAGRMFGVNLRVLRRDGRLPADDAELDEVQASLDAAVAGETRPGCTLHQRQIAFRRS